MDTFTANQPTTSRFGDSKSFTPLQMEAALCAWEWMCENRDHDLLKDLFEGLGSNAMRHCAMQAGDVALQVYDHMEASDYNFADAYDWEFVPRVLLRLDWEALTNDNQFNKGIYKPPIEDIFIAVLTADLASSTDPSRRSFQRKEPPTPGRRPDFS